MGWSDRWRGWLKGRAFRRLRKRHGTAPDGLAPGQWVRPGEGGGEGDAPPDELALKLRKISAAYREARKARPAGRRRR